MCVECIAYDFCPEFLVRGKKKFGVNLGLQKKEVLPYIVLVFLFIFKLQIFQKKVKTQKV